MLNFKVAKSVSTRVHLVDKEPLAVVIEAVIAEATKGAEAEEVVVLAEVVMVLAMAFKEVIANLVTAADSPTKVAVEVVEAAVTIVEVGEAMMTAEVEATEDTTIAEVEEAMMIAEGEVIEGMTTAEVEGVVGVVTVAAGKCHCG